MSIPSTKTVYEYGTPVSAFHVDTWLSNRQAYSLVELAKVIDDPSIKAAISAKLSCSFDKEEAFPSAIKAVAADLVAQGWDSE